MAMAAPVQLQSDADRQALAALEKSVDELRRTAVPATFKAIQEVESICWVWCPQFERALLAYRLGGNTRHLVTFVQAIEALKTRLSRGPEGYLGFRGIPLERFRDAAKPDAQLEVNITEFSVAHVLCDFVGLVRADPALLKEFGAAADSFLALASRDLAGPKWRQRGDLVVLGRDGAVFRMAAETGPQRRHLTDPHNKQSKMCRAYLALYRVTGDDEYFKTAIQLGTRFKRTLRFEAGRYLWHYWDPAGDWDRTPGQPRQLRHWVGAEHRSGYHRLTLEMAEALYDHGVVFTREDMQRFTATQTQVCWNGSLKAPQYFRTDGKAGTERGQTTFLASVLARFDPKLQVLCFEHGGSGSLAGKYLAPRTPEPRNAQYRDQFVSKPENAAFLRDLEFVIR